MSRSQGLELAASAAERWAQDLEPQQAIQVLVGFGLWSPSDGIAPTESLDVAYGLAEQALSVSRQAIFFRPAGRELVCQFVYAGQLVRASAQPHALALTRAVLRAAYGVQLL